MIADEFASAQIRVKQLPDQPPENLLKIYGLYKQATDGNISGKRPGMLDFRGQAKYDSWAEFKGMSSEDAMKTYVDFVNELFGK